MEAEIKQEKNVEEEDEKKGENNQNVNINENKGNKKKKVSIYTYILPCYMVQKTPYVHMFHKSRLLFSKTRYKNLAK